MSSQRQFGIAAGGNWIVDRVKMIDRLPGRGMLANIHSESRGTGGAPANVLVDLARMKAPFPLVGMGVVGDDADGEFVLSTGRAHGIDMSRIVVTKKAPTSFTDVMVEESTGDRSFFHCRGANATFEPSHIATASLTCRIFHLGYLLLLDRMDEPDAEFGTVAAATLRMLQGAGFKTSLDVVSEESDRFHRLVPPSLRYVDYLILNEIEAGRVVRRAVRDPQGVIDSAALHDVVEALYQFGNMEMTAVHMPEGVYIRDRQGHKLALGSLVLPDGFIQSALGAGDAFCAGMLYGLHEGWDYGRAADLGTCCATACLSHSTATQGVVPMEDALKYRTRFPRRDPPVNL